MIGALEIYFDTGPLHKTEPPDQTKSPSKNICNLSKYCAYTILQYCKMYPQTKTHSKLEASGTPMVLGHCFAQSVI